jgi:hypothetical protein
MNLETVKTAIALKGRKNQNSKSVYLMPDAGVFLVLDKAAVYLEVGSPENGGYRLKIDEAHAAQFLEVLGCCEPTRKESDHA